MASLPLSLYPLQSLEVPSGVDSVSEVAVLLLELRVFVQDSVEGTVGRQDPMTSTTIFVVYGIGLDSVRGVSLLCKAC